MSTRRVLIVDDHADSCELFELALTTEGHLVHTAADGFIALDRMAAEPYDVAIIDIGLPGMDGYELARRARATLGDRTPRLVALTGYGRESDIEASMSAGFTVHLVKPIAIDALVAAIG